MPYLLCVDHIDPDGSATLCATPCAVSLQEFAVIRADVFRYLDGPGVAPRLSALRPNRLVVTGSDAGVLFSAYRG